MYQYILVKEKLYLSEVGEYESCGILVLETYHSHRFVHSFVSDVSVNISEVAALVDSCNQLQLSPVHLMDVVEDFLCSQGIHDGYNNLSN